MAGRISAAAPGGLWRGLRVQGDVIGALMLRELHTRYGRENIGYLWLFAEPALLAGAVAAIHAGHKTHFASDIRAVPFALTGYVGFILFRGVVTRAESAIEANRPLLYHRMVTLYDMMLARALLEGAGTVATFALLTAGCVALGLGDPPARLLELVAGFALMLWFAFALSMGIAAATHDNKLVAKFIHPLTYLLMPASGAFYMVAWLPEPWRSWAEWFPMTGIFELIRYGQFDSATADYVHAAYVVACNLVLTVAGLLALNVVRRRVHL